jgi:hypothetical protein
MSITTCNSSDARGMRDLKPQYESTEKRAMIVKMMAPAVGYKELMSSTETK